MGSLGIGQVVRQRILVPRSGVRIPHPQPNILILSPVSIHATGLLLFKNLIISLLKGLTVKL